MREKGRQQGRRILFHGRFGRYTQQVGRHVLLGVVGLLALVALMRMLTALLEALALMLLALVVAALTLPRHGGWYWRALRRQVPIWMHMAAQYMGMSPPPQQAESERSARKE